MLLRWLKFNFVGGLGIGVQLAALWLFVSVLRINYLIATAAAVEIAAKSPRKANGARSESAPGAFANGARSRPAARNNRIAAARNSVPASIKPREAEGVQPGIQAAARRRTPVACSAATGRALRTVGRGRERNAGTMRDAKPSTKESTRP